MHGLFKTMAILWVFLLIVSNGSGAESGGPAAAARLAKDGKASKSLHFESTDGKSSRDSGHKSTPSSVNRTKSATTNGNATYTDDEYPTQPLRNTAEKDSDPPYVESGAEEKPKKELPLALIIASPVVAVFIIVFVCVAYYCHSAQLDARARELAIRMKADEEMAQVMVPPPRPVVAPQDNTDMEAEHTSLRSVKTQTSSESKRGSVIEDREVIKYSRTRRHSTFII